MVLSCSTQDSYVWITSNEGVKIWVKASESTYSYYWDGGNVDGVANGIGNLRVTKNGKTIILPNQNIFYGAINQEGIIRVSPKEFYLGEIVSKKYNGFGVLIKECSIIIGNFVESKADGFGAYYQDGNIVYRGMWKEHQLHGEGIQYANGDSICGVWEKGKLIKAKLSQNTKSGRFWGYIDNNLPNGQGTMEYVYGWTYVGNWKDGNWSGEGELTTPEFVYSGEWNIGVPHGEGLVWYANGCYYNGAWKEGKRSGWGEAYNIDSSYYQGEWADGDYAGNGMLYFADGSVYDGQWSNGLQHGLGSYKSEEFYYVGQWEEGWINGEGHIEYKNGDYYEGNFVENKRYGLGFYNFHEGNYYDGEFVDDKFSGLGIFHFQDGSWYEGEFFDGKIYGDGTFYYVDGSDTIAITAEWNGTNEFPKYASILFANGDIYEGEILNGTPTNNGVWFPNEKNWFRDNVETANDYYKIHKESIDKIVTITSISLTIVTLAATSVATLGATTPALAGAVTTLMTVSKIAETTSTIINVADIAVTVSSSAVDGDWAGVANDVVVNAAFILLPKGVNKVLKSDPARKTAAKLSSSAIAKGVRKSVITITKSKPFKKVSKIVKEKSGNITRKFISATTKNLEKYSKTKLARKILARQLVKNRKIVEKVAKKLALSEKQQLKLLTEMSENPRLAKLVRENPEYNISRWLKTRNHVDKTKIVRTPKGRYPTNARVYAGNTYYFDPALNSGLAARLKNNGNKITLKRPTITLTEQDLIELDKLFPDGVPFTKSGFPDFTNCAFKGKDGKPMIVDIGKLSGNSQKDISIAETIFQKMGYNWEDGYTWHHIEGSTSLIRVPRKIHQLIDHSGGMSMSKL